MSVQEEADRWVAKAGLAVAILTLLGGAAGIIATVALYQGRIEERVQQVDKRLDRIEAKLDHALPAIASHPAPASNVATKAP